MPPKTRASASVGSFDDEGGLQHALSLEAIRPQEGMEAELAPLEEPSPRLDTRRDLEDQEIRRLARMASLDPNDGIAL
jgi:hypothetical protein